MSKVKITGLEANLLLYGLDRLLGVDENGKLKTKFAGYKRRKLQKLRDKLFDAHEHPEEKEE